MHIPIKVCVCSAVLAAFAVTVSADVALKATKEVSKEHPRLLGSREDLQKLAKERSHEYQRVKTIAKSGQNADDYSRAMSLSLVCAVDDDKDAGQQAVKVAMKYVSGPIKHGHVTFGHDLALCGIVYDLCCDCWTVEERARFIVYMNKTVDANIQSETSVFHNGWYAYKHWGYGLACYATYFENPRAREILKTLEEDYSRRAAPALEMAGDGGGWAEGYYVNYWSYEWMFFCEVAARCEGKDYFVLAPRFYKNRALASMFEQYPGIAEYGSRRPVPMGDGGGRTFGGDRDKALSTRRILVSHYHDDSDNQVVHTFDELTPRSSVGNYAYKDFLWHDTSVKKGDLAQFRLSHYSPGPGYVYARSSWENDATYFFFKCGDRFTAHQHLDVGNFLIYKDAELVGDGGHYDNFGSRHDVNYHLRTIAHNAMLILDPAEQWLGATSYKAGIRAAKEPVGNDGGQTHSWPNHNGGATDPQEWQKDRKLFDLADMLAYDDKTSYLYVAGDCTRAYAGKKCRSFVRQIVFIRPGTFVVFDQVESTNPDFKKTWLLQAMSVPTGTAPNLVITNGKGRLFVQALLPANPQVTLNYGKDLYSYGGKSYPPEKDTGPAPECRIEISPPQPALKDLFLNVLTATGATVSNVDKATADLQEGRLTMTVGKAKISFQVDAVGGSIVVNGSTSVLGARR